MYLVASSIRQPKRRMCPKLDMSLHPNMSSRTGHGSHYLLIDTLMASVEAIVIDLSTLDFMDNNMEKQKGWVHVRN